MKKEINYPYNEVQKFTSIKEMLEMCLEQVPDKPAYKYKDKSGEIVTVTYKEFIDDTNKLGTALSTIDALNSHIAILAENSYNWITVYLTVLKSNGVYVPVDKELPLKDVMYVLEHSDSEVLFISKKYEKYIPEISEKLPKIKYFIGFDREEDEGKILSYKKFTERGADMLSSGDDVYTSITTDTKAMKMLVYTSGTTGMAKGVMLSEHNLVSMIYYGLQVSNIDTVGLSVLPYNHTYEAVADILVTLHHHGCLCINENLKTVLTNLQVYKPEYIMLVPAFVEVFYKKIWATAKEGGKAFGLKVMIKLSNFLRFFGIDIRRKLFASIHNSFGGNLVRIICGGAPVRKELGYFFESIGIQLKNGYGITECSPLISVNRDLFNDCTTVGVPIGCLDVKLENKTPDGEGEICVKGDTVMLGYYKDEKLTAESIKDGWFSTGDYGKINKYGQIIITGRKKNLIVLKNGKNVFPEELEGYIMNIPYVQEVVVSGIKDENGAETGLKAEVFLNQDEIAKEEIENPAVSLKADIKKICDKLPIYKTISEIKIRDTEFEKTATKKIKR